MQNPVGFEEVRNKLIIDLFYTTGMRRAELIHLKRVNVDLSKNTIKVLGKRNKERILPLLPIVANQFLLYGQERLNLAVIVDADYFFLTKIPFKKRRRHTIPRLFQPPTSHTLIDCCVVEVSERAVRSNSPARSQITTSILPPPPPKNLIKIPFEKRRRHTIPRPFQPKPHRPTFDCHVLCDCDWVDRSI